MTFTFTTPSFLPPQEIQTQVAHAFAQLEKSEKERLTALFQNRVTALSQDYSWEIPRTFFFSCGPSENEGSYFLHIDPTIAPPTVGLWRLQAKLGEGNYGAVHRVFNITTRQLEVIKLSQCAYRYQSKSDPSIKDPDDIENEITLLREIHADGPKSGFQPSPTLALRVHRAGLESLFKNPDFLSKDTTPLHGYIAPLCDGTVLQLQGRFKSLTPHAKLQALRPLVEALHHLHAKEIVHLDIHPGNVYFHQTHLVLGDFGSARRKSSLFVKPLQIYESVLPPEDKKRLWEHNLFYLATRKIAHETQRAVLIDETQKWALHYRLPFPTQRLQQNFAATEMILDRKIAQRNLFTFFCANDVCRLGKLIYRLWLNDFSATIQTTKPAGTDMPDSLFTLIFTMTRIDFQLRPIMDDVVLGFNQVLVDSRLGD